MKLMKSLVYFASIVLLAITLTACGKDNPESGKKGADDETPVLKMGTSADFPPFESRDEKGNFVGFDIDLAQTIADELGYKLEITDMKFEGLISALQFGKVDMVLAGMSATADRKENVDFSKEYHRSSEMFLTKADSPVHSLEELKGKTVGVQLGTIQEEGADKLKDKYGFKVKKVDDASVLIMELLSGKIDVAYMDKQVATGYAEEHGLHGFDDPTSSSPGMAIAFPKGSDLVDQVNEVLDQLEKNGELQKLKNKWELEEQ
jgi:Bacterial extracellular solute-binding proteins, family 3.